ncbi:UDP-2,4-diacetamido-2,4,6-trideoxy-beta-L-altropyranose hydrolase [subsurface metagenome]
MKIAIRTDGGPNIGIGHIERCLILARQLWKNGSEIFFICKQDEKTAEKVQNEGFEIFELSPDLTLEQDLQRTLIQLKAEWTQIVITDSYAIDENYLDKLAVVAKLITIDDLAPFSFPSDIVVNQNIYTNKLKYHSSTGKTKFLLGPKFALLRPEYSDLERRKIEPKVKKILITLGGTDFHNLTPRILEVLGAIDQDFSITVVIGAFFTN